MLLLLAALTTVSARASDIAPLTMEEFSAFSMSYFGNEYHHQGILHSRGHPSSRGSASAVGT